MNDILNSAWELARSLQGQFKTLPSPVQDCTDRVVIVTGANSGLGREAARHFVRLNASRVILACRDVGKGEAAKRDIELSTQRNDIVEVWPLDLSSFDSVKEFAARTRSLGRLDILLNNASVLNLDAQFSEGHERMVTVNVLSTLLLTLLLLPILRKTSNSHNVVPHVVIVSSSGAFMALLPQRHSQDIFDELKNPRSMSDRYGATKLLQLMMMQRLAGAVDASAKGHVRVNSCNPGLCQTALFRAMYFPVNLVTGLALQVVGRTSEVGSRTLMTAAFGGEETHGRFMSNCELDRWPELMKAEAGETLTGRVWNELMRLMEEIQPGVTDNI